MQIAFVYAGDLWVVGREGGVAQRLTTGAGVETRPYFSPDGNEIAFTGEYDGNIDIYVVPASGGVPRQLTWHPAPDQTVGWLAPSQSGNIVRLGVLYPRPEAPACFIILSKVTMFSINWRSG